MAWNWQWWARDHQMDHLALPESVLHGDKMTAQMLEDTLNAAINQKTPSG